MYAARQSFPNRQMVGATRQMFGVGSQMFGLIGGYSEILGLNRFFAGEEEAGLWLALNPFSKCSLNVGQQGRFLQEIVYSRCRTFCAVGSS
jgi:hypothetical protein